MILQSLNAYYERLRSDDEPVVPPLGFAWRPVSFALLLDESGHLVQVQDLRRIPLAHGDVPGGAF